MSNHLNSRRGHDPYIHGCDYCLGRAIENTNFTNFEVLLAEEFEWHSMNSGRATSREDTLRFVRETE